MSSWSIHTRTYFNPRTHRGVRRSARCSLRETAAISIHAPIVGCDLLSLIRTLFPSYFNPRTHRGVRLRDTLSGTTTTQFQSTHPSWGATLQTSVIVQLYSYFNPRTHRGVRPNTVIRSYLLLNFNPRTHRGVRQLDNPNHVQGQTFQSTHPSWGATISKNTISLLTLKFQSTHPSWGATISRLG